MTENAACIFCRILDGHEKASFVAQGNDAVAFLDLHPINEGHTLVVPRKHFTSIGDVDEVAAVAMWSLARRVAAGLRVSGLRCEAINLFLADGAAAGQEVFHSHLHVIPRWQGDGFGIKFPPHYGAAADRKTLDEIAARLRKQVR
ncbi:MAG TPA: HIT family protein [Methylomirabilota bacterium]|jgi:histidine triad (HIT) family protein|nr:HIT family protein [Methylomirabilota bacterium]